MPVLSPRRLGIVLVVISALVFSLAGVFTRGVSSAAWDIIFWRGLAAAGFTLAYLALRGHLRDEIRAFGKPALLVAVLSALGTSAFIPAFKLSSVANVALIYASAPFVAAFLAWVLVRELPKRRVMIAAGLAMGGVALIVGGTSGGAHIAGDALALVMTVMMAGVMVVYRFAPATTAALPAAVSSLFLLPLGWYFGDPLAVPPGELPVLVLFGLVFAVASVTLSEGARRLPASETALISTLEVPLAPTLAILMLNEWPGVWAVVGGTLILGAVVWSQRPAP